MNLKDITRQHIAGGLIFHMIPYHTIRVSSAVKRMEALAGKADGWTLAENVYALCDPLTVEIECTDDATPQERGLAIYFHSRNGDFAANWEHYQDALSGEMMSVWLAAYDATRDKTLDAPPELQNPPGEDADPEAFAATSAWSETSASDGSGARKSKPKPVTSKP